LNEFEFCNSVGALNNEDLNIILKDHYKRKQNNESSKRSRYAKKQRFEKMKQDINVYRNLNKELKRKISAINVVMEKYNKKLQDSFRQNPVVRFT